VNLVWGPGKVISGRSWGDAFYYKVVEDHSRERGKGLLGGHLLLERLS